MAVSRTFTIKEATFGAETFDADNGGPLSLTIAHTGTPVPSRTGADRYPRRISVQDRNCVATLVVGEFKDTRELAGIEDLAVTVYYDEDAEEIDLVVKTMRLYEVRPTQNRSNPSERALVFVHQSADGQAAPIQDS